MSLTAATSTDDVNRRSWGSDLWAYSYRNADALYPAETALLAEFGDRLATARLLDLGIGTGRTTLNLAPRVAHYVGLDYSPAMVERARARCPGLDLHVGDARALTAFDDASFDVVLFSFNGLDYVDHSGRQQVLAEVHRVLKAGGVFLFSSHNRDVAVPAAHAFCNLKLSRHPARLAKGLLGYGHGILNSARLKSREVEAPDHALRNDAANHFGLLTYYIRPVDQIRQLHAHGFTAITAHGLAGQLLSKPAADYMVHYRAEA